MYQELNESEKKAHESYFKGKIQEASLKSNNTCNLDLPFFHTCTGKNLRSILLDKEISPSECDVFGKTLTYLFYGNPAYRVSGDGHASRDIGRFPVTFIIDLCSSASIEKIFPFDTGALSNRLFEGVCEDNNPAKYELGNTLDDMKSFIAFFYGTDERYFRCKPIANYDDLNPMSFELQSVLNLINGKSSTVYDSRAYTIEMMLSSSVPFDNASIKAVLLPSDLLGDTELDEYLYNNSIKAIPYTVQQTDPADMTPHLQSLAEKYMQEENIL